MACISQDHNSIASEVGFALIPECYLIIVDWYWFINYCKFTVVMLDVNEWNPVLDEEKHLFKFSENPKHVWHKNNFPVKVKQCIYESLFNCLFMVNGFLLIND